MTRAVAQLFLAGVLMVLPVYGRSGTQRRPGLPVVTIYWKEKAYVELYQRGRAIYVANRAFRRIGIELNWRDGAAPAAFGSARGEIIELQVDATALADVPPEVLAYATPGQADGVRIHIFLDRVRCLWEQVPNLLGYVLAHEIGHVLQGVPRHSEDGILKVRWTGRDYNLMQTFSLKFSPEDADRIGHRLVSPACH